ncbi:ABC transporter substrate-binding protein [Pelagicoccus sp. SDUM812003]|uniref:ABC transporter substrate-binding protein n=1 Tax=Pelagicoccus sp. SDUM812003 TaxID=3041267 RepID=UPI00280CF5EE|nr:ABC transporter substrate-binding protein [Pelagicoccus sp. SDUM812003]MDQ8202278.1 ABC transporter substrate-binding protein [Pelagicoccus sp. SDUM812003]
MPRLASQNQTSPVSVLFRGLKTPLLLFACALAPLVACSRIDKETTEDGRVIVTLWTSWTGTERAGIDAVVDDFNTSQDSLFIRCLNITDPNTKIMLATAGGNPPDIAIMSNQYIPAYAENNALTPLDHFCEEADIGPERYVKTFWETATYRDHIWALPLTCSVTTLHYNKAIFRELGLDPEHPPQTIEELERINDIITQHRDDGSIERIGHFPLEPGWWRPEWSNWFGQGSFDGEDEMLFLEQGWLRAGDWLASYHERFGSEELIKLRSGFGRFSSPQNPFFAGKVAMVLQGIWMNRFVETFASEDFEYGCAPFPAAEDTDRPYFAIADADLIVIPKGAKRAREAFAFIKYLSAVAPLEKLALAHGKMTSLKEVSPNFYDKHPNPHLNVFLDVANSGHAKPRPQLAHFQNYFTETNEAVNSITYGLKTPHEALSLLQYKQQRALDKKLLRWRRVEDAYQKLWRQSP